MTRLPDNHTHRFPKKRKQLSFREHSSGPLFPAPLRFQRAIRGRQMRRSQAKLTLYMIGSVYVNASLPLLG